MARVIMRETTITDKNTPRFIYSDCEGTKDSVHLAIRAKKAEMRDAGKVSWTRTVSTLESGRVQVVNTVTWEDASYRTEFLNWLSTTYPDWATQRATYQTDNNIQVTLEEVTE